MSTDRVITVPFSSERKHRLNPEEVPEVMEGLRLCLKRHLETREGLLGATIAFRALYRLEKHRACRPNYPEPVTLDLIKSWVTVPFPKGGKRPRQLRPAEEVDP